MIYFFSFYSFFFFYRRYIIITIEVVSRTVERAVQFDVASMKVARGRAQMISVMRDSREKRGVAIPYEAKRGYAQPH